MNAGRGFVLFVVGAVFGSVTWSWTTTTFPWTVTPPAWKLEQPAFGMEGLVTIEAPAPPRAEQLEAREPAPSAAGELEAELLALEARTWRAEDELATATLALAEWRELMHPFQRYYADWLLLAEAKTFTPEDRKEIRKRLTTDVPVKLRPGEAARLLEVRRNWRQWGGETVQESLILALGPQRVLEEAPPEWADALATWYDPEEWLRLFGTPQPAPKPE